MQLSILKINENMSFLKRLNIKFYASFGKHTVIFIIVSTIFGSCALKKYMNYRSTRNYIVTKLALCAWESILVD